MQRFCMLLHLNDTSHISLIAILKLSLSRHIFFFNLSTFCHSSFIKTMLNETKTEIKKFKNTMEHSNMYISILIFIDRDLWHGKCPVLNKTVVIAREHKDFNFTNLSHWHCWKKILHMLKIYSIIDSLKCTIY